TVVLIVLSLLLPAVVWFVVWRRTKARIVNLLIGAAVFFVCFVIALATSTLASLFITSPVILTLVLSLRAGIVEEFGRFIAFKFFLKKSENTGDAVMYGVGHGGIEVYLVFTLAMLSQLLVFLMANEGAFEAVYATAPEQMTVITEGLRALTESSPWAAGVGLVERVIAMTVHIACSVIVFCAARQRKWLYLVLAIALHAGINSLAAPYAAGTVSIELTEAFLAAGALVAAFIAWKVAGGYTKWRAAEVGR
ncbi:MAG TPA: hypothetical protein DEB24_00660, partial [Coriobacteriia bacterium]|nr:hypothetical protein [Coriobacteriia bacterium]